MNVAAVTSPFENAEESLWVVWKSQERVSALPEQEQSHGTIASSVHVEQPGLPPVLPVPPIQRMQYNNVMNRIVQASKRTGNYSDWTP